VPLAPHELGTQGQIADVAATRIGGIVFKYLLMSIVIVPILLGVKAADGRGGPRGLRVLIIGWVLYSILWVGMLYFLRHRWVG
jgi:hypothetical protein